MQVAPQILKPVLHPNEQVPAVEPLEGQVGKPFAGMAVLHCPPELFT